MAGSPRGAEGSDDWGVFSDSDDDLDTSSSPGAMFVEMMLQLFVLRTLSAKLFCTLMYWAFKAGVSEAKEWGVSTPRGD